MSAQPCTFSDPRDPKHCWHWTGPRGRVNHDGHFEGERMCCWCGRIGLAVPREQDRPPGVHGPLLTIPGADANGAEFVA